MTRKPAFALHVGHYPDTSKCGKSLNSPGKSPPHRTRASAAFTSRANLLSSSPDPALCPICGDLLAWNEQACPIPTQAPESSTTPDSPDRLTPAPAVGFTYALGHPVAAYPP